VKNTAHSYGITIGPGAFGIPKKGDIDYSVELDLDLAAVVPSVAGPEKGPGQNRIAEPEAGVSSGPYQSRLPKAGLAGSGK